MTAGSIERLVRSRGRAIGGMWIERRYRFAFRPIQKAGSAVFQQLFHKMRGDPRYDEPPWHKPGIVSMGHCEPEEQVRVLTDPGWTRAVVLRDPFERLLSAYLHKVSGDPRIARKLTGDEERTEPLDFSGFVGVLAEPFDPRRVSDPHWDPQSKFIADVSLFNFIIPFDRLGTLGQELLRSLGAWEEHGRVGWGPEREFAFLERNDAPHRMDAYRLLDRFGDERDRVAEIYKSDYDLLESVRFGDLRWMTPTVGK